jgi:hypothetical protein
VERTKERDGRAQEGQQFIPSAFFRSTLGAFQVQNNSKVAAIKL